MTTKFFNSVGGYSVGDSNVSNIILANGDITSNNITISNRSNLGSVSNVIITGGTANYFLQTDGAGNLSWAAGGSSLAVSEANANAGNIGNTTSNVSGILFDRDSGFSVSNVGNGNVLIQLGSTFKTWVVTGQPNLVAQGEDTVQFIAGNNLVITTSNTPNPPSDPFKYIRFDADVNFVSNGNSNLSIPAANGNVNISAVGNANILVVTGTGANIAGTLDVTSSIITPNLTVNLELTGNTANFSGNVILPNLTVNTELTGNTANFNGASITDLNVSNTANLGNIGNLTILGGSANYVLSTDGSGALYWQYISGAGSPSNLVNGTSNIQIPSPNGNINFSVNGFSNTVVIGSSEVNLFSGSGGNISGANVISSNTLITTKKITVGVVQYANTDGTANQVLTTYGNGITYWSTVSGGGLPIANGNSNVNIPAANGNVNISAEGNANILVVTGTGANITGTANITDNIVGGGNLNISGNAVISGNLTVDGNLVYVNVTDLAVEDPIIQLQVGANGAAPISNSGKDVGTALNYYDSTAKVAFMGWDVSNAEMGFGSEVSISSEVVTFTQYANIRAGNANLGNLVSANFGSFVNNVISNNFTVNLELSGNTANFSGNANVGNLGTAQLLASANITSPQLISNISTGTAPLVVTSTTVVANLNANALQGNTPSETATANSIVQRNADGNITANFFIGNGSQLTGLSTSSISNGNSNVNIPAANGNVNISAEGNANVLVITGTGANITGTANITGNANIGNLGVAQVLASANITSPQLISNISTGTAPLVVTSTTVVANLNANALQGNTPSETATANSIVQRNADGNITANFFIGNGSQLSGLSTSSISNGNSNVNIPIANGNVTIGVTGSANVVTISNSTLNIGSGTGGNISGANVISSNTLTTTNRITVGAVQYANTDGTANQVLTTYGNGITYWSTVSGGGGASISNGTSNVNIATSGGNVTVGVGGTANVLIATTTGVNVTGTLNATGTVVATTLTGTLSTAAQPNITSLGTLSSLTVSSTISGSVNGSAATFTSTSQNSQFNSIGVNTAAPGTAGLIQATNDIIAFFSDDRLKNREGIIENALDKVLTLSGFYYRPNELAQSLGYSNERRVGLSAQAMLKILPEVVYPAPIDDKYYTLKYELVIPLLVEAIKELKQEIEQLKKK